MTRRTACVCIIGAGLMSAQSRRAAADDGIMLKAKMDPAAVHYLDMNMDVGVTMKYVIPGMDKAEIKVNKAWGGMLKFETDGKEGTRLRLTFDRAAQGMDAAMMGGKIAFDTDNPDDEDAAENMGDLCTPMLGESITVALDKEGMARSCKGVDAVVRKIIQEAPGNPFAMQMPQDFNDLTGKMIFGDTLMSLYANRMVKPGETWTRTIRDSHPALGETTSDYRCRLDRVSTDGGHKTALVSYEFKMAPTPGGAPPKPSPMGVLRLVGATGKGTAKFDVDQGLYVQQERHMSMAIEIDRPGAASAPAASRSAKTPRVEQAVVNTIRILPVAERQRVRAELDKKAAERKAKEKEENADESRKTKSADDK